MTDVENVFTQLTELIRYDETVVGCLVWDTDVYCENKNTRFKFKNEPVAYSKRLNKNIRYIKFKGVRVNIDLLVYFFFNRTLPKSNEKLIHLDGDLFNNKLSNLSLKSFKREVTNYSERVRNNKSNLLERRMLSSAKTRAKRDNLFFNITLDDILIPEECPILKIRIEKIGNKITANSPSLDRIDPRRGYVKGNVQVISFKANTMKSDATLDDLKCFADWVYQIIGETYDD